MLLLLLLLLLQRLREQGGPRPRRKSLERLQRDVRRRPGRRYFARAETRTYVFYSYLFTGYTAVSSPSDRFAYIKLFRYTITTHLTVTSDPPPFRMVRY